MKGQQKHRDFIHLLLFYVIIYAMYSKNSEIIHIFFIYNACHFLQHHHHQVALTAQISLTLPLSLSLSLSLSLCPYQLSFRAGLPNYIMCPHRADVN